MQQPQQLADRYVAVWNETDAARRRSAIAELWRLDGEHYSGAHEVRGHDALEVRVTGSNNRNIVANGNCFQAMKDAHALHDAVSFHWEMLSGRRDKVLAAGWAFLLLDREGRILVDYLFFA